MAIERRLNCSHQSKCLRCCADSPSRPKGAMGDGTLVYPDEILSAATGADSAWREPRSCECGPGRVHAAGPVNTATRMCRGGTPSKARGSEWLPGPDREWAGRSTADRVPRSPR